MDIVVSILISLMIITSSNQIYSQDNVSKEATVTIDEQTQSLINEIKAEVSSFDTRLYSSTSDKLSDYAFEEVKKSLIEFTVLSFAFLNEDVTVEGIDLHEYEYLSGNVEGEPIMHWIEVLESKIRNQDRLIEQLKLELSYKKYQMDEIEINELLDSLEYYVSTNTYIDSLIVKPKAQYFDFEIVERIFNNSNEKDSMNSEESQRFTYELINNNSSSEELTIRKIKMQLLSAT